MENMQVTDHDVLHDGMSNKQGSWKYCTDLEKCKAWCYENKERFGVPNCLAVTTHKDGPGLFFPVKRLNDLEVSQGEQMGKS